MMMKLAIKFVGAIPVVRILHHQLGESASSTRNGFHTVKPELVYVLKGVDGPGPTMSRPGLEK